MPLILEADLRIANGFDPASAVTLYWKSVPVLVKQHDREDQTEELTFRILSGVTKQNHNLRVLRIHVSSENDPYFLHTLEVTEDDFQNLKAEQGILVDFASFPGKIISLLERCTTSQATDTPHFQTVLVVRAGDSLLKIVETNDFKQLPHITLAFRSGNDFTVKQFLAFRLGEVKADCSRLQDGLAQNKIESAQLQQQLHECQHQLSELQERHSRQTLELQAQLREQAVAAQHDKLEQVAAVRQQLERELEDAVKRHQVQQGLLSSRIAELDAEGRKLRDIKYKLDTQVSELSHKLGAAEGSCASLESDLATMRTQHKQLASDKHSLELQLADAKAQLAASQEKCSSQTQLIAQQQARLSDLEAAVKQWESRCTDLRDLVAGHDSRSREAAAEVMKANDIIEKLQTDVRLLKEKVKRKQAILVRQEEELTSRDSQIAAAHRDAASLSQSREGLTAEVTALRADNSELRAKLEESRQQLQSNEQMIRWLNQQVTDAQLQVSAVPGSRYKFRPSQLAGAAPAASPGHAHHASWHTTPAIGSTTPGLTTDAYSSGLTGSKMATPATAGAIAASRPSAAAKPTHSTFSMAAFSPQTVTPRQDYKMPAPVASTVGRH